MVCMDSAISYNHTIPNSGFYRPVAAQSGEYQYCPPQRWLHNLQLGAVAFLYHPCTSVAQRALLSVLAHSCMSHYIITPFPQLSRKRPLALVVWGRTLELSHVTASDICDWLSMNVRDGIRSEVQGKVLYSLLLTRASESQGLRSPNQEDTQQAVKHCCAETLSMLLEDGGGADIEGWKKKRRAEVMVSPLVTEGTVKEMDGNVELRRKRAAVLGNKVEMGDTGKLESNKGQDNTTIEARTNSSHGETPGGAARAGVQPAGGQEKGLQNSTSDTAEGIRAPELKGNEEDEQGKSKPGDLRMQAAEGPWRKGLKSREKQLKEAESDGKQGEQQAEHVPQIQTKTLRTEQQAPQMVDESRKPDCGRTKEGGAAGAAGPVQRVPTARTDEAVWAAAALSFLLALLALSVLHTRLYRNWRSPPSLYWRDPTEDYDSVAEVIRRRLRMVGQRKRRGVASRRQECALLPTSSSEDSS
ncbi:tumor protein p53-inducible protein 13-like [Scleropages formosus]|nr:tumor protein p53-inducible protein 13-like [Scleropages formosus]